MKKSLITSALLLLALMGLSQSPPQGSPPATNASAQAAAAWYRGGNNGPPLLPSGDNIFGTRWNSPIYTITNGTRRMKLNGTLGAAQYSINGYGAIDGVNTSGYLLLGNETSVGPTSNLNIYTQGGAFSLLHLNGTTTGELAYRPWMRTGVTFTDANDLAYVGLRSGNGLGTNNTITEMVVAWGNESAISSTGAGPDDMVFRFMGSPTDPSLMPGSDPNTPNDYDGKHIARFASGPGNLGIGPSFSYLSEPTHRLDVEGNARLRSVPASNSPDCIMLGNAQSGAADIEFQRLALPGDNTKFLDGTGAWQTISSGGGGSINGAHNGVSVSSLDNTKVSLGQSYSQSGTNPAALLENRYIPMNDHNIFFTNNPTNPLSNTGFNKVAIGTDNPNLVAKLNVHSQNSGEGTTLSLTNANTTGALGTYILVNGATPTTGLNNYGERISVSGAQSLNQGTEYVVTGGNEAVGLTIDANGGTNGLGIRATATGTGQCVGVQGVATGGSVNYAIRGDASAGPNSYAGFFQGNVHVNGSGTFTGTWMLSDRRYKQNIEPLQGITAKLQQLHGYTYGLRTEEFKEKNFPQAEQIGLIAQELQEVFPQLVREDERGYLAVNYDGMVPVLLEAIKEQQAQIDELRSQVSAMASDPSKSSGQVVELADVPSIVLDQNAPNPFAEQTVITFALPAEVRHAQMLFHDGSGKLVQTVEISERGSSKLIVFGSRLSAGNYTYSLVADGRVVDTKMMVKQ